MSTLTHTPSPWTVGNADWSKAGFARYEIASNKHICTGDARLIAAAPDLLEALQGLADGDFGAGEWTDEMESFAHRARAAITKATGGKA